MLSVQQAVVFPLAEAQGRKAQKLSSVSTGVTTTVTTNKKSAETITGSVTTIQTAATCTKIVFDGGYTLFANVQGIYSYKQFK